MLEVKQLTKRFGGLIAVSEVDLSVVEGEIVSLIGPMVQAKPHYSPVLQVS